MAWCSRNLEATRLLFQFNCLKVPIQNFVSENSNYKSHTFKDFCSRPSNTLQIAQAIIIKVIFLRKQELHSEKKITKIRTKQIDIRIKKIKNGEKSRLR